MHSFWISAVWVFIRSLSSSSLFDSLISRNPSSCRITLHGPAPQPILHRNPVPQPIMYRDASIITSNDRPSGPLVETWLLVRPVFTIETVALRTIIHCRQSQPFFPTVHKERRLPMPFTSSCRFFPVLSSFLIMLEFIQQYLRCDLLLRHR